MCACVCVMGGGEEWERGFLKYSEMGEGGGLPKMWEKAAFEMEGS